MKPSDNQLKEAFETLGFFEYKSLKSKEIPFSHDVYLQCERNTCGQFGKNHACPSETSSESERKNRILSFDDAYIISIKVPFRSKEDIENSGSILKEKLNLLRKNFPDQSVAVLGVGPCTLCESCTAPQGGPCRFPDKTQYSMEGCGIDVVKLSKQKEMTYNAGTGNMVFFATVLY
ncbi:MAG: DUF2284 domain-containing protein [Anaerofustis sp.]